MIGYSVLDGPVASQQEVDDFVRLVRQGGAVAEHHVRQGIQRKGARMILAQVEDTIVGVAALKIPQKSYRYGIESKAKSGHPIPKDTYPYELGYVAVHADHGGKGIGTALVESVLGLSLGRGLFATTGSPAMKTRILPRAGFEPVGNSWVNTQNQTLHLFVFGG